MDHTNPHLHHVCLSATQLKEFVTLCTGAPPDWPHRGKALSALLKCCRTIGEDYPHFRALVDAQLADYVAGFEGEPLIARDLLARRHQSHRLYSLLLELGRQHHVSMLIEAEIAKLVGSWALVKYLTGTSPGDAATQRIKQIVRNPASVSDPAGCVGRYLARARSTLRKAIQEYHFQAVQIGLAQRQERADASVAKEDDPLAVFNADLQRMCRNHIRDATAEEVQGTVGRGTLTKAALKIAGKEIGSRVRGGEDAALGIALQVLTRLPARLLKKLPLSRHTGATVPLAWLDVQSGTYVVDLRIFVALADQPDPGHAALHLSTSDLEIKLPPVIAAELTRRFKAHPDARCVGDIITVTDINPRSTLVPSHGHRITLSRVQSTLPALALGQGHHRWPVALACQAWWLVSRGRRAYSVCTQADVDAVMNTAYAALGWGRCVPDASTEKFIGSPLTPSPLALRRIAGFLKSDCLPATEVRTSQDLNSWAAYAAFMLAWSLALRARATYPIHWADLLHSDRTTVNDKDVARDPVPPIPVCPFAAEVFGQWQVVVTTFFAQLKADAQSNNALVPKFEMLHREAGCYPVFSVDGVDTLRPAGTDTWRRALPTTLRLAPNFGRHWWPWRLQKAGLAQRCVDLLMRHQTSYLSHYGGYSANSYEDDLKRLGSAMQADMEMLLGHGPRGEEVGDGF